MILIYGKFIFIVKLSYCVYIEFFVFLICNFLFFLNDLRGLFKILKFVVRFKRINISV